jgi:adenylate cyclase
MDVRQIGRELGVRYLVEGSIRKSGSRVRISGQLVDADTGNHIWADRFDRNLGDVFELQDEITQQIASAIEPNLQGAEVRRASSKPTENLNAYDLYLRALASHYSLSGEGLSDAFVLTRQALKLDPAYDLAKAFAAYLLAMLNQHSPITPEEQTEAIALAKSVLAANRDDPKTIAYAAHALSALSGEHILSLPALERALRLNPNSAHVLVRSGWVKTYVSDPDSAIDLFLQSARLDPLNSEMGFIYCGLFAAHLIKGKHKQALEYAQHCVEEMPRLPLAWRSLSIALVNNGRITEAKEAMRTAVALSPDLTMAKAERTLPFKDSGVRELFIRSYRQAGLT